MPAGSRGNSSTGAGVSSSPPRHRLRQCQGWQQEEGCACLGCGAASIRYRPGEPPSLLIFPLPFLPRENPDTSHPGWAVQGSTWGLRKNREGEGGEGCCCLRTPATCQGQEEAPGGLLLLALHMDPSMILGLQVSSAFLPAGTGTAHFLSRIFYGGQRSAVSSSYILWWHFSDGFTIHQVVFLDMLPLLRLLCCFPGGGVTFFSHLLWS